VEDLKLYLEGYLGYIRSELKRYARESDELCKLKGLDFRDRHKPPDYSDKHIQYLYLLRYYGAYLCEYRYIYNKLLEEIDSEEIEVLSLGAGGLIDLAGLQYALSDKKQEPSKYKKYRGYDIFDWHREIPVGNPDKFYIQKCISKIDFSCYSPNVFMFGKSISDIGEKSLDLFLDKLKNSRFRKDRVFIINSARKAESHMEEDKALFERVKNAFESIGFRGFGKHSGFSSPAGLTGNSWKDFFKDFLISDEHIKFLKKELPEQCARFKRNGRYCKDDCKKKLGKAPMLSPKYVRFQIYELRSRGKP